MTVETLTRLVDESAEGHARAEQSFGEQIQPAQGDVRQVTAGGLDSLLSPKPDEGGFRRIDVYAKQILQTPQVLGRIVLTMDKGGYHPAVLMPKPTDPNVLIISTLPMYFRPDIGLTEGIALGTAVAAQTQAPEFGNHGNNRPSAFEPGHFASWIAAGVDIEHGEALRDRGDKTTHEVVEAGVPKKLSSIKIVPANFPTPTTIERNITTEPDNRRYPLYWHEALRTNDGAALATFDSAVGVDAVGLLLGAAFNLMSDEAVEKATHFTDYAIMGA